MLIIKRPPHDSFTFRLFYNLDKNITKNHQSFYINSMVLDPGWKEAQWSDVFKKYLPSGEEYYRSIILENIKSENIVLGIKDHLTSGDFNPWVESTPNMVEYFIDLFTAYKDKNFLLFTSLENLQHYIKLDNVSIIPWGGDITNQQSQYSNLDPIIEKNLESKYSYVCLNRGMRANRSHILSLLFGMNLEDTGLMSCLFNKDNIKNIHTHYNWQYREDQQKIKELISNGVSKIITFNFPIQDSTVIYKNYDNDNVSNFKEKLSSYYKNSFVEIISETSFTEECFLVTEKTSNSVHGCNFPIWISSKGFVSFLRNMGLDVFDDIIDHSYDSISNPIDRMYSAIVNNKEILTNSELAKEKWINNKDRFLNNSYFIKNNMYLFYKNRANAMLNELNFWSSK